MMFGYGLYRLLCLLNAATVSGTQLDNPTERQEYKVNCASVIVPIVLIFLLVVDGRGCVPFSIM